MLSDHCPPVAGPTRVCPVSCCSAPGDVLLAASAVSSAGPVSPPVVCHRHKAGQIISYS